MAPPCSQLTAKVLTLSCDSLGIWPPRDSGFFCHCGFPFSCYSGPPFSPPTGQPQSCLSASPRAASPSWAAQSLDVLMTQSSILSGVCLKGHFSCSSLECPLSDDVPFLLQALHTLVLLAGFLHCQDYYSLLAVVTPIMKHAP